MRENAVREQVQLGFITVEHIGGKHNLADAFTKEEKNDEHFITCRNLLVTKIPNSLQHNTSMTDKTNESKNNIGNAVSDDNTRDDTNGRNKNKTLVLYNNVTRDVADVTDSASSMCLLRRSRGVLSYVRRTVGQIL
jgi:hypothetical protein